MADLFGTEVYAQYGTDKLFSNPTQRTVDDFWLHLLVETGVIGLLAFVAALVAALLQIVRGLQHGDWQRRVLLSGIAAAALALVANSLTTMLLESNSVAFFFWLMLGMGTVLASTKDGAPSGIGALTSPHETARRHRAVPHPGSPCSWHLRPGSPGRPLPRNHGHRTESV